MGPVLIFCFSSQVVGGFALTCTESPAVPWCVIGEENKRQMVCLKVPFPSPLPNTYSFMLYYFISSPLTKECFRIANAEGSFGRKTSRNFGKKREANFGAIFIRNDESIFPSTGSFCRAALKLRVHNWPDSGLQIYREQGFCLPYGGFLGQICAYLLVVSAGRGEMERREGWRAGGTDPAHADWGRVTERGVFL